MEIFLLLGAALAVLSIAVVAYPFLKAWAGSQPVARGGSAGAQYAVPLPGSVYTESIYEAIRTLQLEYQLGRVLEETYQEQLRDYRLRAAAALRQQVEAGEAEDAQDAVPLQAAEWYLEQEILVARAALSASNGRCLACPQCGASVGLEVGECSRCHARLAPPGPEAPGVPEP